jgi:uncharacterized damage-inducible protein DinB
MIMKEHLLTTLENSRNYTFAVAEAMTEKNYDFKPVPEVWTFLEQLHHMAYGIGWWKENYIKGNKIGWAPTPIKKNKQEVLDYLSKEYAALTEIAGKTTITDDFIRGFAATLDHITHHRGQLVLYLRCKGIAAPEYIY